jgi:hypothetical protein
MPYNGAQLEVTNMGKCKKIDFGIAALWCAVAVVTSFVIFGIYEAKVHMQDKERIFHLKCTLGDHLIFNDEIRYGDYYLDAHVVKIKTGGTISSVYDTCVERLVDNYGR